MKFQGFDPRQPHGASTRFIRKRIGLWKTWLPVCAVAVALVGCGGGGGGGESQGSAASSNESSAAAAALIAQQEAETAAKAAQEAATQAEAEAAAQAAAEAAARAAEEAAAQAAAQATAQAAAEAAAKAAAEAAAQAAAEAAARAAAEAAAQAAAEAAAKAAAEAAAKAAADAAAKAAAEAAAKAAAEAAAKAAAEAAAQAAAEAAAKAAAQAAAQAAAEAAAKAAAEAAAQAAAEAAAKAAAEAAAQAAADAAAKAAAEAAAAVPQWAILGSSSAAGYGVQTSWAQLLTTAYASASVSIHNLALYGMTTYEALPVTATVPSYRRSPRPDANIDKALSYKPKVVFISYPSNDTSLGYTSDETVSNVKAIRAAALAQGTPVVVLSSQPRSDLSTAQMAQLKDIDDRLSALTGACFVPLRTALASSDGKLATAYDTGDGIHPNEAGHRLIAQKVKSVLDSGLCVTITQP